jgi:hypothetical protein
MAAMPAPAAFASANGFAEVLTPDRPGRPEGSAQDLTGQCGDAGYPRPGGILEPGEQGDGHLELKTTTATLWAFYPRGEPVSRRRFEMFQYRQVLV